MKISLIFLTVLFAAGASFYYARIHAIQNAIQNASQDVPHTVPGVQERGTPAIVGSQLDTTNPQSDEPILKSLGRNSNNEILESSGLGISTFVKDAVWTINDSGRSNEMFLLRTSGELLAQFSLSDAKNLDWEAMSQFSVDGQSYLLIADVGDNLKKRKSYQLHLVREPDCSRVIVPPAKLPIKRKSNSSAITFQYEDGPKNCEAICVDPAAKEIWLVEKVYYETVQDKPPGIYVLPLTFAKNATPLIAKRIATFPPRNVTGMAFSPDGKRLLIRNYVNAHLYSRTEELSWRDVIKQQKPKTVVLPIQRQGEAVCFTPDSNSVILTSEFKRQPIWLVGLKQYFDP